jgi:hypothetical protein
MTPCEEAEWNLQRLQDILQLRQELAILHDDNEPNHQQEIENTKRAIEKLKKWIKDNCDEKPPCP